MNDYPVESYYIYNINMNFKLYNETVKRLELLLPNNKGILALNVYILQKALSENLETPQSFIDRLMEFID